ncbi:MAG: hypothetical protein H7144_12785 [Burkholderiales bacterium]|nr:hypothetical protein [Phycisphaerae bacterium]
MNGYVPDARSHSSGGLHFDGCRESDTIKFVTVSIHRRLQSDTIHLPEAAALVGKEVRIIVLEEPTDTTPCDLSALDRLAGNIDLDYEVIEDLRRWSVA